ncbi:hypothetical protein JQ596_30290 [Bradyrhizobium manausense]|uniref:hypothetical protein n=1 Tax=Bradyrhizobium manausense TaxID=989370 RepID=UPI001BA4A65F|nr:hypothetical protein [Bradyrhizobium manausense]MBR0829829.1 hypothetical protein [Bradyrhizobium manausense]
MSVKAIMATILKDELTSRGVTSLTESDYEAIIKRLIEMLTELELGLAARDIKNKPKS